MPDTGSAVGLDDSNDIDKIVDCIKSFTNFVAGEWEEDRWIFDIGTGDAAFRGFLSLAGGVILVISGTADPRRTEAMIQVIKTRLGVVADLLKIDDSLAPQAPVDRVAINEGAGMQEANLTKAMEALGRSETVYRRGNAITIPDRSVRVKTRYRGEANARGGTAQYADRTQIGLVTLTPEILSARLERVCFFYRLGPARQGANRVPAYPTNRMLKQILNFTGDTNSPIKSITGVMTTPFLRPDGTVCDKPGYDDATGVFFDPCGKVFPPMPAITPENAQRLAWQAANRLAHPFREFRFDTSKKVAGEWMLTLDRDRTAAVSAFMAVLAVHAVRTSPAYIIEAPMPGSGKTLIAELAPMMLIGDDPALVNGTDMSSDTFSNDFDTALLAARGFAIIDNVHGKIGGGKLLAMLTSKEVNVRLYYSQQAVPVGAGMLLLITANNAEIDYEIARRAIMMRIDTGSERPNRNVHGFDPRDEVLRDRGQMVIDALTIMRAYVVAGCPKQNGVPMGSFEDWGRVVRDALMWAGLPDIAVSTDEAYDVGDAIESLDAMIDAFVESGLAEDDSGVAAQYQTAQIVALATERMREVLAETASSPEDWVRPNNWDGPPPFRRQKLREACLAVAEKKGARGMISKERLGHWLSSHRRPRRGWTFTRALEDGRAHYRLVKTQWPSDEGR